MDKEALVYVDLDGVPHLMGRLWARTRKNKESAPSNTTRHGWKILRDSLWSQPCRLVPARFTRPQTRQCSAPSATPRPTVGAALMRRMERRRAEREGGAPRTLQEIDFLMLVDDEARQGALALRG